MNRMIDAELACMGCFISANLYKIIAGTVGLSLFFTAAVVRHRRLASPTRPHGFEVLPSEAHEPRNEPGGDLR
jgi:hypothetical protein